MRWRVESIVLPVATHPGKSGTEAPQSLSGSLLMRTRYHAAFSRSVSFKPRLALDGCQRSLRHVVAKLAADSHTARLGRMLELTMATSCNHQRPAIVLQHPN